MGLGWTDFYWGWSLGCSHTQSDHYLSLAFTTSERVGYLHDIVLQTIQLSFNPLDHQRSPKKSPYL